MTISEETEKHSLCSLKEKNVKISAYNDNRSKKSSWNVFICVVQ